MTSNVSIHVVRHVTSILRGEVEIAYMPVPTPGHRVVVYGTTFHSFAAASEAARQMSDEIAFIEADNAAIRSSVAAGYSYEG